jgi:predicted small lipoprotein YifL
MANKNNVFTILLASVVFALALAACGSKPAKLSPADETLANEQGIDKDALLELRKYTDSTLTTAIAENLDVNLCFKDSFIPIKTRRHPW